MADERDESDESGDVAPVAAPVPFGIDDAKEVMDDLVGGAPENDAAADAAAAELPEATLQPETVLEAIPDTGDEAAGPIADIHALIAQQDDLFADTEAIEAPEQMPAWKAERVQAADDNEQHAEFLEDAADAEEVMPVLPDDVAAAMIREVAAIAGDEDKPQPGAQKARRFAPGAQGDFDDRHFPEGEEDADRHADEADIRAAMREASRATLEFNRDIVRILREHAQEIERLRNALEADRL